MQLSTFVQSSYSSLTHISLTLQLQSDLMYSCFSGLKLLRGIHVGFMDLGQKFNNKFYNYFMNLVKLCKSSCSRALTYWTLPEIYFYFSVILLLYS